MDKNIELQEKNKEEIKIYTNEQLNQLEECFGSTNLITAFKLGRELGNIRLGECFGLILRQKRKGKKRTKKKLSIAGLKLKLM